jgi:hypothetical protein
MRKINLVSTKVAHKEQQEFVITSADPLKDAGTTSAKTMRRYLRSSHSLKLITFCPIISKQGIKFAMTLKYNQNISKNTSAVIVLSAIKLSRKK